MLDEIVFYTSGKNKRLTKGKKGGKKKAQDAFARKELYAVKAPSIFASRNAGKTIVNKTYGTSMSNVVIFLICVFNEESDCRDRFGVS